MAKTNQIIGSRIGLSPDLDAWLGATGTLPRAWAQAQFDHAVSDIFGYHALQLGCMSIQTLAHNRMPHQWYTSDNAQAANGTQLLTLASALPFFEATLDLVTLPFTLDAHSDPEHVIEECARVLVPEGKLVITGLSSKSLWGVQQFFSGRIWPDTVIPFGYQRLLQTLQDTGFSVSAGRFGGYGTSPHNLPNAGLDKAGDRWWPHLGALYTLTAIKRVKGVTPRLRQRFVMPSWQQVLAPINPFPAPAPKPLSKPLSQPLSTPSKKND